MLRACIYVCLNSNYRKPLIVAVSKSGLRLPASNLSDFLPGTGFQTVYPEMNQELVAPHKIRRVIFVTGQLYYDLVKARADYKINVRLCVMSSSVCLCACLLLAIWRVVMQATYSLYDRCLCVRVCVNRMLPLCAWSSWLRSPSPPSPARLPSTPTYAAYPHIQMPRALVSDVCVCVCLCMYVCCVGTNCVGPRGAQEHGCLGTCAPALRNRPQHQPAPGTPFHSPTHSPTHSTVTEPSCLLLLLRSPSFPSLRRRWLTRVVDGGWCRCTLAGQWLRRRRPAGLRCTRRRRSC